jgi:hypothetical protein
MEMEMKDEDFAYEQLRQKRIDNMKTNEEYRLLEQQLAECKKQIVMLHEVVAEVAASVQSPFLRKLCVDALAATLDLKDCILCDAETVAWESREMLYPPITKEQRRTTDIPLYKARKQP